MKLRLPLNLLIALIATCSTATTWATDYTPGSDNVSLSTGDKLWNSSGSSATQSGTVTLTGQDIIGGTAGSDITISSIISGSGTLIKEGDNKLILNKINTYTNTIVNGGILELGAGGGSGIIRGTATINEGAQLITTGKDSFGWAGGANALTKLILNGGRLTLNGGSEINQTMQTAVTMKGSIIDGTGRLDFFTNSSLTTLASNVTSEIKTLVQLRRNDTTFNVTKGSTATGVDLWISGVISQNEGNGVLVKTGSGTLVLSGNNTYSGNTRIQAGILKADFNSAGAGNNILSLNSTIMMEGGTLFIQGKDGAATTQNLKSLATSANSLSSLYFMAGIGEGSSLTVDITKSAAANIDASSFLVMHVGENVTLSATNATGATFTTNVILFQGNNYAYAAVEGTTVKQGTLLDTIAAGGDANTNYQAVGTVSTTGAATAKGLFVKSTGEGQSLTLGAALTFKSLYFSGDYNYALVGTSTPTTAASLLKEGKGALNLGNMALGNMTSINIAEGKLIFNANTTQEFTGVLSGGGDMEIAIGDNILVIRNTANTYSGNVTISSGKLRLGTASGNGASTAFNANITVKSGTELGVSLGGTGSALTFQSITLENNSLLYNDDGHNIYDGNIIINGNARFEQNWDKNIELKGILSGAGNLSLKGSTGGEHNYRLTNNANTYSGIFNLDVGGGSTALILEADNAAQFASVNLMKANSILRIKTNNATIKGLSGASGKVIADGNGRSLTITEGGTYSGAFEGALSLIKSGTGTLTLNGTSTAFTGNVRLESGSLVLGSADAIKGATLQANGGSLTIDSASLSNTITINGAVNFALTNGGKAHVELSHTGNLILGETLSLDAGISLGTISSPASTTGTITGSVTANGGTISLGTNDLLTISGALTFGTNNLIINLSSETPVLANGNYELISAGSIANFDPSKITLTGVVIGGRQSASFTQGGSGLHANSIYFNITGNPANLTWTSSTGTWKTDKQDAIWDTSASDKWFLTGDKVTFDSINDTAQVVTIDGDVTPGLITVRGTTDYSFSSANGGKIVGGTSLIKEGTNTLTLNSAHEFTGGIVLAGGTLEVAHTGALGSGNITDGETSKGALNINWGTNTTGSLNIAQFTGGITLSSGILSTTVTDVNNNALVFAGGQLALTTGTLSSAISVTGAHIITIAHTGDITLDSSITGSNSILFKGTTAGVTLNSGKLNNYTGTISMDNPNGVITIAANANKTNTYSALGQANIILKEGQRLDFISYANAWTEGGGDLSASRGNITLQNGSRISGQNPYNYATYFHNNFILSGGSSSTAYFGGFTGGNSMTFCGSISGEANLTINRALSRGNAFAFKDGWIGNSYTGATTIELNVTYYTDNAQAATTLTPFGTYDKSTGAGIATLTQDTLTIKGNYGTTATTLNNGFVLNGGTLILNRLGNSRLTKEITVAKAASLEYSSDVAGVSVTFEGGLKGEGALTLLSNKKDTQFILDAASNNYTGALTIGSETTAGGDLVIKDSSAMNWASVALAHADAKVTFDTKSGETWTQTTGKTISGNGSITVSGAGSVALNATNSYEGGTTIQSGATAIAGNTQSFGIGLITVNGGTLNANNQTLGNDLTVTGGTISNLPAASEGLYKEAILKVQQNITVNNSFLQATNSNAVVIDLGKQLSLTNNAKVSLGSANASDVVTTSLGMTNLGDAHHGAISVETGTTLTFSGTFALNINMTGLSPSADSYSFSLVSLANAGDDYATAYKAWAQNDENFNLSQFDGFSVTGASPDWTLKYSDKSGIINELRESGTVTLVNNAAIPEPSTASLGLLALAGLLLRRRRVA